MAPPLSHLVAEQVEKASQLYHRLVIVAGPPRSGKTSAFRDLHSANSWPLVNINLALSERLLELTVKQRALRVARLVDDIVQEQAGDTVLLDNIEMLFHPDLKQDPLRLLQSLSRNRTIVTAWRGAYMGSLLTYAAPDHPEFRRYDQPQALVVSSGPPGNSGTTATQEHSA
ncbi:MAG: BREX-3 system P-loop-containing protein BrxF [Deltaproteobacteria bacterium]|nr:MAG: BREX-3 system P-loop-containing protein BrxF [Deltaproteobacteria bacterium]